MLWPMPTSPKTGSNSARQVALFRNGRNQAVRIPREFEFESAEVLMHKEGDQLILTPVPSHRLLSLLASWSPFTESQAPDCLEVEDLPLQDRPPL